MPGLGNPGEFLRHALLDTVVPHAQTVDIEKLLTSALENGADDLPSVLSSITQRALLFFGAYAADRSRCFHSRIHSADIFKTSHSLFALFCGFPIARITFSSIIYRASKFV